MLKSFKQLIYESFSLKSSIDYGTDFYNKDFIIRDSGNGKLYVTYFKHEERDFKFIFYSDEGSLSYASYNPDSKNKWNLTPSKKSDTVKNMSGLFNKILTIMFDLIKQYNFPMIRFVASEPRLDSVYKRILTSSSLQELMKQHGYKIRIDNIKGQTQYVFDKNTNNRLNKFSKSK